MRVILIGLVLTCGSVHAFCARPFVGIATTCAHARSEVPKTGFTFMTAAEDESEIPEKPTSEELLKVTPQASVLQANPMANNPLIQGEVTLDGSLIVLVPAAVIAIGGFVLAFYIALTSSDQIVEALNAIEVTPLKQRVMDDPTKCRGLCSSQDEDLKGLEQYMKGFARSQ